MYDGNVSSWYQCKGAAGGRYSLYAIVLTLYNLPHDVDDGKVGVLVMKEVENAPVSFKCLRKASVIIIDVRVALSILHKPVSDNKQEIRRRQAKIDFPNRFWGTCFRKRMKSQPREQ